MGLFDKLKTMAAKKAVEALDSAKQKLQDQQMNGSIPSAAAAPATPPPVNHVQPVAVEEAQVAAEEYDGYTSYDEYQNNDYSDEEFEDLGEMIDEAIYDDTLDDEDVMEDIYDTGEEANLSAAEIDAMIEVRMADLREAIDCGVSREVAYRTRSVWQRCPSCGHIVPGNFMFCSCGYQVRHKVVTALAASYLKQGKLPTPSELKRIGADTLRDKACSRLGITHAQADRGLKAAGSAANRLASRLDPESKAGQAASRAKSMLSSATSSSSSRSSSRKSSSSSGSLFGGSKKSSSSKKPKIGLGIGKKRR